MYFGERGRKTFHCYTFSVQLDDVGQNSVIVGVVCVFVRCRCGAERFRVRFGFGFFVIFVIYVFRLEICMCRRSF
jgi:hypothetical protein